MSKGDLVSYDDSDPDSGASNDSYGFGSQGGRERTERRVYMRDRSRSRSPVSSRTVRRRSRSRDRSPRRDVRKEQQDWRTQTPSNTIMVTGLAMYSTEGDIRNNILQCGLVAKDIRLIRKRETGAPRGFAFVEFATVQEAQRWMEARQGSFRLDDKVKIYLQYSVGREGPSYSDTRTVDSSRIPHDWVCAKCSSTNFKRRESCYRCGDPRDLVGIPADLVKEVSTHPTNVVMLRSLDSLITEEDIIAKLAAIPEVSSLSIKSARIGRDQVTKAHKGVCYLEMNNVMDAMKLHQALASYPLSFENKQALVSYCRLEATTSDSRTDMQAYSSNIHTNMHSSQMIAQDYDPSMDYNASQIHAFAEYSARAYASTPEEYAYYYQYYQQYYTSSMQQQTMIQAVILFVLMLAVASQRDELDSKLQYGLLFRRVQQRLKISNGHWTLAIPLDTDSLEKTITEISNKVLHLSNTSIFDDWKFSNSDSSYKKISDQHKDQLKGAVKKNLKLRAYLYENDLIELRTQLLAIQVLLHPKDNRRTKRTTAFSDWLADGLGYIFGLAPLSKVEAIKDQLNNVTAKVDNLESINSLQASILHEVPNIIYQINNATIKDISATIEKFKEVMDQRVIDISWQLPITLMDMQAYVESTFDTIRNSISMYRNFLNRIHRDFISLTNNKFPLNLLPSFKLKETLNKIKLSMPNNLDFALQVKNIWSYYKHISCAMHPRPGKVLITCDIPLVVKPSNIYSLYHVRSFPSLLFPDSNNFTLSIPSSRYFAISEDHQFYLSLSDEHMEHTVTTESEIITTANFPIFKASNPSCNYAAWLGSASLVQKLCEKKVVALSRIIIENLSPELLVISTPHAELITITCPLTNEVETQMSHTIQNFSVGTYFIKTKEYCNVYSSDFIFKASFHRESAVEITLPFPNISVSEIKYDIESVMTDLTQIQQEKVKKIIEETKLPQTIEQDFSVQLSLTELENSIKNNLPLFKPRDPTYIFADSLHTRDYVYVGMIAILLISQIASGYFMMVLYKNLNRLIGANYTSSIHGPGREQLSPQTHYVALATAPPDRNLGTYPKL